MLRERKQSKVNEIDSAPCEGKGGEEAVVLNSVARVSLIAKVVSQQRLKGDTAHCRADI